jgi:hypothetical protein
MIPIIPKDPPPAKPAPPPKPDLRVRTDRDEVLAGLDEDNKLYDVWEEGFAIGPRNIRYSLETLLELEAEGVVAALDCEGAVRPYKAQVEHIKAERAAGSGVDDAGVEGNTYPDTIKWQRA